MAKYNRQKIIILGSGPAGLAAALYTARASLEPLVLTGKDLGGQVSLTSHIENYPGFPQGISGQDLANSFMEQATHFGAKVEFDSALQVDLSKQPFIVITDETEYHADAIIVATGATPRHIEVPGEREYTGLGVSYCATCDGHFFRGKNTVVVGGGDSAIEEALFLTRYANSVTVIHRRDTLRAGVLLQNRALNNPKIHFIWNTVVTEIQGKETVNNVRLHNLKTNQDSDYPTDGVFIFIGYTPNTQLFKGQLDVDDQGYVKIDPLMQTNIPGVFAAGEVSDPHFRQVVTSAGAGAAAAIQATRYLGDMS